MYGKAKEDFPEWEAFLWNGVRNFVDVILLTLFLFMGTLVNLYAIAKIMNVVRAIIATRFFTSKPLEGGLIRPGDEPMCTIQICAYNEGDCVRATIAAACSVDWPKDKLTVQVLDDSTEDEDSAIIEECCAEWRAKGANCVRRFRPDRIGYKAGSLHYHTPAIQGDFVGMFDADHQAHPMFLRRSIPHFFDDDGNPKEDIGLVQAPWSYYNIKTNLLTEYDALNLDCSHVIEQVARHAFLKTFSFNGTGGIWRKQCIQAGGGWSWETITEDLDLSYECYMAGYKFVYLRDIPQRLEVPAQIRAHVQQKFRWTKGYWQVTRKTLFRILRDPDTPPKLKFEVIFQYTGASAYTLALLLLIVTPLLSFRDLFSPAIIIYTMSPLIVPFLGGTCTVFGKYAAKDGIYKSFWSRCTRLRFVPMLFIIGLGMMVFETFGIWEGMTSDDATFLRTPKEGGGANKKDAFDDDQQVVEDKGDDDDDDDDDDSDDESNDESTDEKKGCFRNPFECKELSKKGQVFRRNLLLGLAGIFVALYSCGWCAWLYKRKKRFDANPTAADLFMVFLLPMPSIGLYYIHGMFLYVLLKAKLEKYLRKRAAKLEEEDDAPKTDAKTSNASPDAASDDDDDDEDDDEDKDVPAPTTGPSVAMPPVAPAPTATAKVPVAPAVATVRAPVKPSVVATHVVSPTRAVALSQQQPRAVDDIVRIVTAVTKIQAVVRSALTRVRVAKMVDELVQEMLKAEDVKHLGDMWTPDEKKFQEQVAGLLTRQSAGEFASETNISSPRNSFSPGNKKIHL